jgi:hypothetical protein
MHDLIPSHISGFSRFTSAAFTPCRIKAKRDASFMQTIVFLRRMGQRFALQENRGSTDASAGASLIPV